MFAAHREVECRAVPPRMCIELDELKGAAMSVFREVRAIRRSRDLSFEEDVDLNGRKRASVHSVLKHLLVGHGGQPCPGGTRPIAGSARDDFDGDQGAIANFVAGVKIWWLGLGQWSALGDYWERRRSTR